jgi:hypothetical protein
VHFKVVEVRADVLLGELSGVVKSPLAPDYAVGDHELALYSKVELATPLRVVVGEIVSSRAGDQRQVDFSLRWEGDPAVVRCLGASKSAGVGKAWFERSGAGWRIINLETRTQRVLTLDGAALKLLVEWSSRPAAAEPGRAGTAAGRPSTASPTAAVQSVPGGADGMAIFGYWDGVVTQGSSQVPISLSVHPGEGDSVTGDVTYSGEGGCSGTLSGKTTPAAGAVLTQGKTFFPDGRPCASNVGTIIISPGTKPDELTLESFLSNGSLAARATLMRRQLL